MISARGGRPGRLLAAVALAGSLLACGAGRAPEAAAVAVAPAGPPLDLDPPAAAGAFAPEWAVGTDQPVLTWIEPLYLTPESPRASRHRVRIARYSGRREDGGPEEDGGSWGEAHTVTEGEGFFANWADFPAAARAADGSLFVHWLEKNGDETFAYGPQLARSSDGGVSWHRLGPLHDDATQTEHGFVSWLAEGGGLRAFWLDGRAMVAEGPMAIRTAYLEAEHSAEAGPPANEVLDARICECCSTSAAMTAHGPIVAYRDRSAEEVRDIYVVRRLEGEGAEGWSEPVRVAADEWHIPGCPVNGPAISAEGPRVAVAWFTAAEPAPRVQLALSQDGGASFGPPLVLDDGRPLGRVDLALATDGAALVSWLALDAEDSALAELRLARVPAGAVDTGADAEVIARTSSARASGFPRLLRQGDALYLAWVEVAEDRAQSRVRVRRVPL